MYQKKQIYRRTDLLTEDEHEIHARETVDEMFITKQTWISSGGTRGAIHDFEGGF